MTTDLFTERKLAIMQLKQGKTIAEVAQSLDRSIGWVWKWQRRFKDESWSGLKDRSRAPRNHGNQIRAAVKLAIRQARTELEAEAELGKGLKYIGGQAIKTRLRHKKVKPLPSVPTIERVIREACLTQQKEKREKAAISYPHMHATQAHQHIQVDIVPHFLQGGQRAACFNAIDVVSRYPTGQAFAQRRAQDAAQFLIQVWQELGVPQYTQVDNEACFSGGTTHTHVLGKVVRLALHVGTELLFSPCYHPESNGFIERFHQDYNYHVWEDTYLRDLAAVNQQAHHFFALYRQREDHSQLNEQTPQAVHDQSQPQKLPDDFALTAEKLPLREGHVHFMRRVSSAGAVRVLNMDWRVPHFEPAKGVWVTIEFQVAGATLSIFDNAPDAHQRRLLASYPFPLKEPVLAHDEIEQAATTSTLTPAHQEHACASASVSADEHPPQEQGPLLPTSFPMPRPIPATQSIAQASVRLLVFTLTHTARLTRRLIFTMF